MIALASVLVVIGLPVAAVLGLLKLVDALQRRRAAVIARQIEVTDAIHCEFGAIVAPTVHRARGGWRVRLPMDPRDPRTAAVVELAARTLGAAATMGVRSRRPFEGRGEPVMGVRSRRPFDGRGEPVIEVTVVAPPTAPRRPATQSRERIASAMSA